MRFEIRLILIVVFGLVAFFFNSRIAFGEDGSAIIISKLKSELEGMIFNQPLCFEVRRERGSALLAKVTAGKKGEELERALNYFRPPVRETIEWMVASPYMWRVSQDLDIRGGEGSSKIEYFGDGKGLLYRLDYWTKQFYIKPLESGDIDIILSSFPYIALWNFIDGGKLENIQRDGAADEVNLEFSSDNGVLTATLSSKSGGLRLVRLNVLNSKRQLVRGFEITRDHYPIEYNVKSFNASDSKLQYSERWIQKKATGNLTMESPKLDPKWQVDFIFNKKVMALPGELLSR